MAQFNYVAASEQPERSFRSVQSTVRSSYNNVNASIGSVRAYSQSVISADSAPLKATEAGYEVGTRTIVDVLDSPPQAVSGQAEALRGPLQLHPQHPSPQAAGILEQKDWKR